MIKLKVLLLLVLISFFSVNVYSKVSDGLLLIPNKASMAFVLRVNDSKIKQFKKSGTINKRILDFESRYSVKLEDIKFIYGASYKSRDDMLFVCKGSFNSSSYSSMMSSVMPSEQGEKLVLREYLGIKYIVNTLDNGAFAILGKSIAIMGLESRLKLSINLFLGKSKDSIKKNSHFYNPLQKAPSNVFIRVVSGLPKFMLKMPNSTKQPGSVNNLRYINTIIVDYTSGKGKDYFRFKGLCLSKEHASLAKGSLKDFVEMQLPFWSLLLSNQSPVLIDVIKRGKYYSKDKVAIAEWFLTPTEFDNIVGRIEVR